MGSCSRKAAGLQLSCPCHRERQVFLQEVRKKASWDKTHHSNPSLQRWPWIVTSQLTLPGDAQGGTRGVEGFWQFPSHERKAPAKPRVIFSHHSEKGEERSAHTLPASTAQEPRPPTVTCSKQTHRWKKQWDPQEPSGLCLLQESGVERGEQEK